MEEWGAQVRTDEVFLPETKEKGIRLFLRREDEIHPEISGNKWRKLKYHLHAAKQAKLQTLLTFGGAYSNHIAATAAAGNEYGFRTIGIIRGEGTRNPTLDMARSYGMELKFISRERYRKKMSPLFIEELRRSNEPFHLIAEGGADDLGVKGCEEIIDEETMAFDFLCCACGTGATVAGMARTKKPHQHLIGFSALKGGGFLSEDIQRLSGKNLENVSVETLFHFGGYARYDDHLLKFIRGFREKTCILLDPVYTGKMMFGVIEKITKGDFPSGSKILAIHTGGIQGWKGFEDRFGISWS